MASILIGSDVLGRGNEELGALLMEKFFTTLADSDFLPDKILFYNSGVLLCRPGSPVEPYITVLGDRGVELSACGTCISHFDIEILPAVGSGTMKKFVEHICAETGTISL